MKYSFDTVNICYQNVSNKTVPESGYFLLRSSCKQSNGFQHKDIIVGNFSLYSKTDNILRCRILLELKRSLIPSGCTLVPGKIWGKEEGNPPVVLQEGSCPRTTLPEIRVQSCLPFSPGHSIRFKVLK